MENERSLSLLSMPTEVSHEFYLQIIVILLLINYESASNNIQMWMQYFKRRYLQSLSVLKTIIFTNIYFCVNKNV